MTIEVINHGRLVWVNSAHPNKEDMVYLSDRFGFHPLDLEDCLSHIERPKIDEYDDYMFIVMHFPRYLVSQQVTRPSEVDFFIGPNFFVTVHDGTLNPVQQVWQACYDEIEERQRWMGKGAGRLFYHILARIVDDIFPMLDKIGGKINSIEENVFTTGIPDILQQITLVRRDIIALRRVIRPQLAIIHNLESKERPYLQENLDIYFGDISDAFARASDVVEDYKEVIEGLGDMADSITSYRINEVIRTLTVISVIILPLTLLSGIYGMNINLPLARSPYSFFFIAGLMLMISVSMMLYFRHRHWL